MAKYGRFLFYKRNTLDSQTSYVGRDLTVVYNIRDLLGKDLTILYDINTVDARSLWEEKEPGQALWIEPVSKNPTARDEGIAETVEEAFFVLDEGGEEILDQAGLFVIVE